MLEVLSSACIFEIPSLSGPIPLLLVAASEIPVFLRGPFSLLSGCHFSIQSHCQILQDNFTSTLVLEILHLQSRKNNFCALPQNRKKVAELYSHHLNPTHSQPKKSNVMFSQGNSLDHCKDHHKSHSFDSHLFIELIEDD